MRFQKGRIGKCVGRKTRIKSLSFNYLIRAFDLEICSNLRKGRIDVILETFPPPLWASYDSVFARNLELKTIFCFRLNNLNRKFDTLLAPSTTSFREIETREERAKLPEKDDALTLKTFWQTMSSLHTSLTVMNVYCFLYIFSKLEMNEFEPENSCLEKIDRKSVV